MTDKGRNCIKCGEPIAWPRIKYCMDCSKYVRRIPNLIYPTRFCSECGSKLTNQDIYRKSRMLSTPGVYDCEECEQKRIKKLGND
jgi:hypothetical protein